jgi:hypothetical protein
MAMAAAAAATVAAATAVADLDFREKGGYTRNIVEVHCPAEGGSGEQVSLSKYSLYWYCCYLVICFTAIIVLQVSKRPQKNQRDAHPGRHCTLVDASAA